MPRPYRKCCHVGAIPCGRPRSAAQFTPISVLNSSPAPRANPIKPVYSDRMSFDPANPLIVQADRSIFLEVHNDRAENARAAIAPFAELEKSPEHLHTYRITPLSLWNAASSGVRPDAMIAALEGFAKYPVPENVIADLRDLAGRWGRLKLLEAGTQLALEAGETDRALLLELTRHKRVSPLLAGNLGANAMAVPLANRGLLKQVLLELGWPVEDLAGFTEGLEFPVDLADRLRVRDYQTAAANAFHLAGSKAGGSGVIVLPPGSGKTVVGILAMNLVGQRTLVLTTNRTSVAQWRREILEKTQLSPDDVLEYGPDRKGMGPVTLCTYQMLTHRKKARGSKGESADSEGNGKVGPPEEYPHMELFKSSEWGLIIYDEVHLLPAPVFRMTAEVQARRRLGLTATLIREDGREGDVFSLIGPKRYDLPWKDLESQGWIATAACCEVRSRLPEAERLTYAVSEEAVKFRIAAENPVKRDLVAKILELHHDAPTLVIGQYIGQLELLAADLECPLITGQTKQADRERIFQGFRDGAIKRIVLSKVGNFALDLPEAQVLVQVSGAFGSRQEEAQRLGRLLRPKRAGRRRISTRS
jgi:DNA excision repair protein ERCC-3